MTDQYAEVVRRKWALEVTDGKQLLAVMGEAQ